MAKAIGKDWLFSLGTGMWVCPDCSHLVIMRGQGGVEGEEKGRQGTTGNETNPSKPRDGEKLSSVDIIIAPKENLSWTSQPRAPINTPFCLDQLELGFLVLTTERVLTDALYQ